MSVTLALAALKAAFQAIDPSPQPDPVGVWVWPDDGLSISYAAFPFIIIRHAGERRSQWREMTQGSGLHVWYAEVLIALAKEQLPKLTEAQSAESLQTPWLLAAAKVLAANRGLGGQSLYLGDGSTLFDYIIDTLGWENRTFWGIALQVAVAQNHSLPSL
jgi:hypothetical protein